MKRILMIATVLMICLVVAPTLAQPSLSLIWSNECRGELRQTVYNGAIRVECWDESQPPEPTATPEPGATETPTIEPTVTPTPTPDPGVAMCAHDPLVWHDLYDETQGCRYDHEHGDDPDAVADIFGQVGAWYGRPGWAIGGPWAMAAELAGGHRFWKWYVRRDITPGENEVTPGGAYIKAFRIETHVATAGAEDGALGGIGKRYHSFSYEAQVCLAPASMGGNDLSPTETCGILRAGGVFDYGNLYVSDPAAVPLGATVVLLPNAGDGQDVVVAGGRAKRIHPSASFPNSVLAWYPATWSAGDVSLDIQVNINDNWGWIEPVPDDAIFHRMCDAGCGSDRNLHVLTAWLKPWAPEGNYYQWVGSPMGEPDPNCTQLGQPGCGYVVAENMPSREYIRFGRGVYTEYDTTPAGQASWITYPN